MIPERRNRPTCDDGAASTPPDADNYTAAVRCRRCKRALHSDVSVHRGCGWRCARHLASHEAVGE